MILEKKLFILHCDNCREQFIDDNSNYAWNSKADAINAAKEDGWIVLNGKHLCPDCYHYDGRTNEVVEHPIEKDYEED